LTRAITTTELASIKMILRDDGLLDILYEGVPAETFVKAMDAEDETYEHTHTIASAIREFKLAQGFIHDSLGDILSGRV
jgi:hypothetical protein